MGVLDCVQTVFIVVDTAGWKAQASPTTIPDNAPRTITPDDGPRTCTITPDDGPRTIPPDNGTSSSSESESGDHEIAMATSRFVLLRHNYEFSFYSMQQCLAIPWRGTV